MRKEAKRYVLGIFAVFVLLAILRNATNEWPYRTPYCFYMIAQIGCALTVSCRMLTVQSRIIDTGIKRLLLGTGGLLLLYFCLQMSRYGLFEESPHICRYLWYGYYIPMTLIPLMALYTILRLSVPGGNGTTSGGICFCSPHC